MRSGRSRSVERTRSANVATPGLVRSATQSAAAHLQLARVLQDDDALAEIGDLGQQRVDQRGLARRRAAHHQDVLALADAMRERLGLARRHDARCHVVAEPVEHVGRLAHGEARRRRHRRHHALEALARLGQLGGDDRRLVGDLAAHVRGDQPDDALGLGAADAFAGVLAPDRGALDPQPAVGVDHHLDDGGIGECGGDGRTEGRAQHLPPAPLRLLGRGKREQVSHAASPSIRRPASGRWS